MRNVFWQVKQTRLINEEKQLGLPVDGPTSLRNLIHAYTIKKIFILLKTLFGNPNNRFSLRDKRSSNLSRPTLMY
jgi:hypothetical protein